MVFGLFNSPTPFKGQKYADLKKAAVTSGHPFIDPEFPPDDKALFKSAASPKLTGIEWKRPHEMCDDPRLFVEGADANDVSQGQLGNCWFVAACSCLAGVKEIWTKVIPNYKEQEWNPEEPRNHPGIFHFQFWRFGEWTDVVIDDRLPTRNGSLVFVHSKSRNEFWSALLEKAYAKLYGCYEALDGGELAEALEDFTAGIAEPVDLVEGQYAEFEDKRLELFGVMKKSFDNRALMAAAIPAKSSEEMEQAIDVGLVKGHAYGITAVKRVALEGTGLFNLFNKDKIAMIRLRNPWGGCEWNGAFSDGSPEWEKIDKASREKIGLTFDEDGEFWMTFGDFCTHFTNMSICRVMNTSFFSMQKKWHESEMSSEWNATARRAGGCINNKDTFLDNPQFVFDITEAEDEALFGLMQKFGRGRDDSEKLTIGFTIMKVEENRHYRCHEIQQVVKSSTFKNSRSIFLRHSLKQGRYVLLACTFEPGHNSGFLLRTYTSNSNHAKEMTLDKPATKLCSCLGCCFVSCKYPVLVSRVKIVKAGALEKQDRSGGADPYAIISCEGHKVTTPVVQNTLNPEWNITGIFYRADPVKHPIKVEIWNSNTLRDEFMGQHEFTGSEEGHKSLEATLEDRKKDKPRKPGKILVEIESHRNLTQL